MGGLARPGRACQGSGVVASGAARLQVTNRLRPCPPGRCFFVHPTATNYAVEQELPRQIVGFGVKREGSGEIEPTRPDSVSIMTDRWNRNWKPAIKVANGMHTTLPQLPTKYMGTSRDVLAPPRASESMVAPRRGRLVSTSMRSLFHCYLSC